MTSIDPRSFLEAVYMNDDLPLSVRMRAAIEIMPYVHPKLAVTAVVSEQSFAEILERRLRHMKQIEAANGNNQSQKAVTDVGMAPRLADRRFRRI